MMLRAIAEGWRISLTDEQLPEIIDRLVEEMTHPETVLATVQRLSDQQREGLAFVLAQGPVKAHVLTRKYGQVRRLGAGRLEWEAAWEQPVSVAERLWFLGLIYREYALGQEYQGEVFVVAPEIQRVLPPMQVAAPAFHVLSATEPSLVRDEQGALAKDVFVVLSHLRNHDVRAREAVLAKHELERVRKRLTSTHRPRLRLLWRICEQARLVQKESGLWQPTDRAAAWLKESALSRQRALVQSWLADAGWNELCAMPTVTCEDTGWRHDPIRARVALLSHLGKCPMGVWLEIESLVNAIYAADPDFLRPDGDYDSWYIRDAESGNYLLGFASWGSVEGALIRYLLEQALCWLGVVALGYAEGAERAAAFKLTGTGIALLHEERAPAIGEDDAPSQEPAQHIVLRSDLSIVVPSTASWYDRFLVERFASWVGEREQGMLYKLDRHSVARALSRGVIGPQIEAFLKRATGDRLPVELQRALKAWGLDRARHLGGPMTE